MVAFRSGEQMLRDDAAKAEAERSRQQNSVALMGLAAHIRKCFAEAETAKTKAGITDRLLKSRRQKAGEYEPDKAALIAQQGGTQLFFNITETKCEALEGWLIDVVNQTAKRFWSLAPTPIPSLPDDVVKSMVDQTVADAKAKLAAGQPVDREYVMQASLDNYDQELDRRVKEAQARAKRMEDKIADQLVEGGFYQAFANFVKDLAAYPTAFLKGPVLRPVRRLKWGAGFTPEVVDDVIPTFGTVSPFDAFPGPNARNCNESYFIEVIPYDRRDLASFRGKDGYSETAINACLQVGPAATASPTQSITGEPERARLENRDMTVASGVADATMKAMEFWGSVDGRMLLEWDPKWEGIKPEEFYEINAILIGDYVVKAILNPNPLGNRPYYASSYIKVSGTIWGKGVAEKMSDCQDATNACHRSLINNLALCSGPQVALDTYLLDAACIGTGIFPRKIWTYNGQRAQGGSGRKPVEFFSPDSHSRELQEAAKFYETAADDRTMIPKYTYGNENVGGAGQTASGLSMLMTSAARGVKRVLANCDQDATCPLLTYLYQWNMVYLEGQDDLKGDCFVVPAGIMATLIKEQVQEARNRFLTDRNNPVDNQIIGLEGRARMLADTIAELNWPKDIIPNKTELLARATAAMEAQATAAGLTAEAAAPGAAAGPPNATPTPPEQPPIQPVQ